MKVLSNAQVKLADEYTIRHEPVASIDLMERASEAFVGKFVSLFSPQPVTLFCGVGNNGGDGLAIARLLNQKGYEVSVYAAGDRQKATSDFLINLEKFNSGKWITKMSDLPELTKNHVVIDALFGSGLSRPIEGFLGEIIQHINAFSKSVVAVDIASGLFADKAVNKKDCIIKPRHTITFHHPKLAFFQPENAEFVGDWHLVDIGLHPTGIENMVVHTYFTEPKDIAPLIPHRRKFDHKGIVKRIQLIVGSKGKMGAAVLASRASMRSGAGLLFVQTPGCGELIMQTSVSEAMVISGKGSDFIEEIRLDEGIGVVGLGPGLGTHPKTGRAFGNFLQLLDDKIQLVLDADAINLLADDTALLHALPKQTILTPHSGEFKRLVGDWRDDFHKLDLLREFCNSHQCHVLLKGANSAVCNANGTIHFNSTGNPGMATAGSGDVLLGMVTALCAQCPDPFEALRLAVYMHGLAGDLAKEKKGELSLIASDLIDFIPDSFRTFG